MPAVFALELQRNYKANSILEAGMEKCDAMFLLRFAPSLIYTDCNLQILSDISPVHLAPDNRAYNVHIFCHRASQMS